MEFDWDAANVAHIRFITAHPMHTKQREIYRGEG
jgi:hypothetical protein